MKTLFSGTAAILAATLLAGCAGSDRDDFGSRLEMQGGKVADIGEQWTEGEEAILRGREMIEDGEDEIDDGEDMVADGKRKVRRGEDMIREGERMKREAEEAYREFGGTFPAGTSATQS